MGAGARHRGHADPSLTGRGRGAPRCGPGRAAPAPRRGGAGVPGGRGPAASADSAPLPSAPLRSPARSFPPTKNNAPTSGADEVRALRPESPAPPPPQHQQAREKRWRRSCGSAGGRGSGSSSSRGGDWYLCLAAAPAPSRGEGGDEKSLPDGGPGPRSRSPPEDRGRRPCAAPSGQTSRRWPSRRQAVARDSPSAPAPVLLTPDSTDGQTSLPPHPGPPFPYSPPLGSFPLPYSFPGCPSDDRGLARILWSPPLPGFYWFERCKQRRHFPTSSMETESYASMLPGICSPLFRTNWHTPGRKNYQNRNAACLRSTRAGRGRGRGHKAEGRWHTTPAQCDRDGVFSCTE